MAVAHQFCTDTATSYDKKRSPALQPVLDRAKSMALQQGTETGIAPFSTPIELKQQEWDSLTRQHRVRLSQAQ